MTRPEIPGDGRPDYGDAGPVTTYRVHVDAFLSTPETTDAAVAETWSKSGLRVTAVTEGQR